MRSLRSAIAFYAMDADADCVLQAPFWKFEDAPHKLKRVLAAIKNGHVADCPLSELLHVFGKNAAFSDVVSILTHQV